MIGRAATLFVLLLLAPAAPACAQGFIVPRPRPIPAPPPQPLAVRSQKVTMQLTDGALKVEVEQLFYNPNSFQMEGTYLFPLPAGATVSSFRMTVDKEPVEGKMLTAEEARRIYESFVRRNVDPAILEYVGRNAFQARVFPIPGGGEKRIYLTYSQAAEFSGGIYQAAYPLNSERVSGQTVGDLVIDVSIRSSQPLRAIYSPTHEVQVRREGDNRARVTFEGRDVRANRDFLLYYTTSEKTFGLNALAHRRPGEDGYAMLMLAPKREVPAGDVQPKDVVFVFDTSGSMQGAKIEQARKALQTVLGALNDRDRFNVIRFSSDVENFRPSVVPASRENREAARGFVEQFRAVGGTAIDDALQAALASLPRPDERRGRAPIVIFMTDGLPTIGTTEPVRILQNVSKGVPDDLRLFSFGVGSDVNTLLLDRLAADHRGAADYISQDEDLETKIGSFYAKIADPVLANVQVAVNGARFSEVYPRRVPDLFAGTQLLLLGRYDGEGRVTVTLTGDLNGRPQRFQYDLRLPDRELSHDFIPKLWGSRKIGFLLEEIRLHGESKELKDEVIRLSKEHGIVTPYTSYLVEEPGLVRPLSTELRALSATAPGLAGGGGFGGGGFGGATRGASPQGPRDAAGKPTAPADRYHYESQLRLRQQTDGFGRSTGQNAVEASKRLSDLKGKEQAETDVEVARQVGARQFRRAKDVWVDETVKPGMQTVTVRYGSDAYFQLVAARTEWARYLAQGRQVTFRSGKNTVVAIADKGKEKLTDAELKALEK